MKIYIASDHAGFEAKQFIQKKLFEKIEFEDLGPLTDARCDYPSFAVTLAKKVANDSNSFGVLICGSGIGVSIVANRFQKIRAALCRTEVEAVLAREHNNANILCLGGRVTKHELMLKMIDSFLSTKFEMGRHAERLALFEKLGEKI